MNLHTLPSVDADVLEAIAEYEARHGATFVFVPGPTIIDGRPYRAYYYFRTEGPDDRFGLSDGNIARILEDRRARLARNA
jgi:hypothetical protein